MDGQALERAFERIDAVSVEGTSLSESGFGPPYGPPWHIVDTATADPETGFPGDLIETVTAAEEVHARLRAARAAALADRPHRSHTGNGS